MEYQELLHQRQSCRAYDPDRPVEQEKILRCLEAVRLSPSACNSQPYHLTACTGKLARQVAPLVQGEAHNDFASQVPCFVVISEAPYNPSAAMHARVTGRDYRSMDIGIAAAHLTLAAADQGLGSCLLGWFDEEKLRALLGLEGEVRLVMALGYACPGDPLREKVRPPLSQLADLIEES